MKPLGVSSRNLLSLARVARTPVGASAPLLLMGVMADALERELSAGADATAVSRLIDPADASVVVLVVGGEPTEVEVDALRRATRARVPIVAVQLDPRTTADLPYVRATHVVSCLPGRPLPTGEIVEAVASCIRADDSALAVRLPVLREPLLRRTIGRSVLRAAAIGALPWFPAEQFPPLAVEQVRMSQRIGAARGQSSTLPVPPELGIVLGVGLPMRSVARRLRREDRPFGVARAERRGCRRNRARRCISRASARLTRARATGGKASTEEVRPVRDLRSAPTQPPGGA